MKVTTNISAGIQKVFLADAATAKNACTSGQLGQWDILAIQNGMVQKGSGYGCAQTATSGAQGWALLP